VATEGGYDKLKINGIEYSGSSSPPPETVFKGEQTWSSDASVQKSPGWKICTGVAGSSITTVLSTTVITTTKTWGSNGVNNIKAGPCTIDQAGCVKSPNYPAKYGGAQSCNLLMTGVISSVDFDTEGNYDTLRVNGVSYSGSGAKAPSVGLLLSGDQLWTSDSSMNKKGWRICTRPNTGGRRLRRLSSAKSSLLISAGVDGVPGSERSLNVGEVDGDGEVAAASTVSVTTGDSGSGSFRQASTFNASAEEAQPRAAATATKAPPATVTKAPPATKAPPKPKPPVKAKAAAPTTTTTFLITKVSVVLVMKGLDFDKFTKNESAVVTLRKTIKGTFLEKLPTTGDARYSTIDDDLTVTFFKGSVKAHVDIRPKAFTDMRALEKTMDDNKEIMATKILAQVKLMPQVKDGSMLETGRGINDLSAYGSVSKSTTADTTTTTTSTTSTTEEPFGPADLDTMDVPNLPTGHPFAGAFATVSPEERIKIAALYAALEPTTTTTTKAARMGMTDGAPSQGLVLVLLCLGMRFGLLAN